MTTPFELDLRTVRAREKHPAILRVFELLPRDQTIVLVCDHDPSPLYQLLEKSQPGAYVCAYLESGPLVWRVSITKRSPPPAAR